MDSKMEIEVRTFIVSNIVIYYKNFLESEKTSEFEKLMKRSIVEEILLLKKMM